MGVIKQNPILECDICKKQVETTSFSCNYKMMLIKSGRIYQSGYGGSTHQTQNERDHIVCYDCMNTREKDVISLIMK